MKILVAWWLGYIWSHVVAELLDDGFDVVAIDSLTNSSMIRIENIKKTTSRKVDFYEADLSNLDSLNAIFDKESIRWIINCAHIKYLWENNVNPLIYYQNNLISTINLLEMSNRHQIDFFVNSSNASIYSQKTQYPYYENDDIKTNNPFDDTKYMIEIMLDDICKKSNINAISLRYSTPIWAHRSWFLWPSYSFGQHEMISYIYGYILWKYNIIDIPENLNQNNKDILCDYIHIVDLAKAYVLSVKKLIEYSDINKSIRHRSINIWSGVWYGIKSIIQITESLFDKKIKVSKSWFIQKNINIVNVDFAKKTIWREPKKNIISMIEDGLNYIKNIENY